MKSEPVNSLAQDAERLLAELAHDKSLLLTQHGQAAAVLPDVQTFHDLHSRIALLESLLTAEKDVQEGRVVTHEEARRRMGRWQTSNCDF